MATRFKTPVHFTENRNGYAQVFEIEVEAGIRYLYIYRYRANGDMLRGTQKIPLSVGFSLGFALLWQSLRLLPRYLSSRLEDWYYIRFRS